MRTLVQKILFAMFCVAVAAECVLGYFVYAGGHAFNSSLGMCSMRWNELEPAYHLYLFGMALCCALFVSLPFIHSAQRTDTGHAGLVDEHFTRSEEMNEAKNIFVRVSGALSLLAGLALVYLISRSLVFLFYKPHGNRFLVQAFTLAGVLIQLACISIALFFPKQKGR
jgi:hypothetical protein